MAQTCSLQSQCIGDWDPGRFKSQDEMFPGESLVEIRWGAAADGIFAGFVRAQGAPSSSISSQHGRLTKRKVQIEFLP